MLYKTYKICFKTKEYKILKKLTKFKFVPNYNYFKCYELINMALEQTKDCDYSELCSFWKLKNNNIFPNIQSKKLNVKL